MLKVHLLGPLEIHRDETMVDPFPTQHSKRLFAFLALNHRRSFSRERLASQFWGDVPDEVARQRLRTAIWRMRKVVEPAGVTAGTHLIQQDHTLSFNHDADSWIDVVEFERLVAPLAEQPGSDLAVPQCHRLQQAVDLYRGNLLEDDYDDWCLADRERLKALFRVALERAAGCCGRNGEWNGAIAWCERLLLSDPLREQVHRDLIRYYYLAGNRAGALTQFAKLVELLARELQVEPMPETMGLCASIRAGQPIPSPCDGSVTFLT